MNKKLFLITLSLPFLTSFNVFAQPMNFSFNPQVDTMFHVSTSTPPGLVWVVDPQGRRTGADPTIPVNLHGQQMKNYPFGPLYEIPNSESEQEYVDDSSTGDAPSSAAWFINIKTTTNQTFIVNDMGVSTGVSDLELCGFFPGLQKQESISLLVSAGSTRQVEVNFDPNRKSILLTRVVAQGDLLNDVKTACQLDQITSPRVCKYLEDQAEAIQDALQDHHHDKAEELIWVFLHSMGESRPVGCKDYECHTAVQEPALNIIIEDAKALLAQVQKDKQSHHGEQDHGGDNSH